MTWDIGFVGLGLLAVIALVFGLMSQLIAGRVTTRWVWAVAALSFFVAGLFVSEALFGWATQAELQPNIDGLSFDETLLGGLIGGIAAVVVTWYVTRSASGARA